MTVGRPRSVTDNKIFDVSKPGQSRPMGTSRPVIVNHSNMVRDRTFTDTVNVKVHSLAAPSVSHKTISPVTEEESSPVHDTVEEQPSEAAPETPKVEDAPSEPTEVEPEAEKIDETEPEKQEPETQDIDPPAGSDSASVATVGEATEKKKTATKEEEQQTKHNDELQKLIDSKQFYVSVAHDKGGGSHKAVWVILIVLVLVVGMYLAIDAGAINLNVNLPYHFFQQ